MKNVSDAYKKANSQIQTPEDLSSSFSPLEDSLDTQSEGEGATVDSSFSTESNAPRSQSVMADVHAPDVASVSSPLHRKDDVVVQMEEEAASDQSTSTDMSWGITIRSQTLETQAHKPMDLSRRGVGGGQSQVGGVHSVANENLLESRISSATAYSVRSSSIQESTLERLSRSQYHSIPHSSQGASRHHSSTSGDQPWSWSLRSSYPGGSRDDSRSSGGSFLQELGDLPFSSSPR